MREHHALGPPCGARGVKKPGQRIIRNFVYAHGRRSQQAAVFGARDIDHARQRPAATGQRSDIIFSVGAHQAQLRAAIADDVIELPRMQFGVDGHRGKAGLPAGKQRLDVLRAVAHDQGDAIAGHETALAQPAGQARDARNKFAVIRRDCTAKGQRRPVGEHPRGAQQ